MKSRATLPLIANRTQAPGEGWFQLVPKGEFKHPESGLTQVLDDAAMEAMANRFAAEASAPGFRGLLVDQDHFSYDLTKSSEAYGWVREVANRENGLWGRIEWTPKGQAAIDGREYKSISPAWLPRDVEDLGGRRVRPIRLDTVGMTNTPNLQGMIPLANRTAMAGEPKSAAGSGVPPKVAAALGISAKAGVEEFIHAISDLKAKLADGESKLVALSESVADEAVAPLKNRFAPELIASLRGQLIANRDAALPILRELSRRASVPAPMHNRALAGHPGGAPGEDNEARYQEAKKAIVALMNRRGVSYKEAFKAVRAEKPHLFNSRED